MICDKNTLQMVIIGTIAHTGFIGAIARKQQAARWWLREQELLPYVITALATLIVGLIAWLK